jgi:NNP family nitrate/nitrite transporter-like MFS transporter
MRTNSWNGFLRAGHLPTLLTALLYFDLCFAVWVLNAAMAPFISEELKLGPAEKGLMLSVPVFAGALMRLPLGILSQYIGRKRAALLNLAIVAVGLVIGWLATNSFQGVIGVGVLLGVAGASFGVALSLGSGWYPPEHKGLAMGIAGAGNSGAVLAVLIAPPLAASMGWREVYGFAVIPLVVAMVLLQVFAKEPPDRVHAPFKDHLKIMVDKDAWVFNLIYVVSFGGYIGLTSFLPTFFHDQYGIAKADVGTYAAVAIVAGSALRVFGGWLSDRIGGVTLLRGLLVVVLVTVLAAATMPAAPWMMAAVLVVAFAAMGAANGAVFQLVPLRFLGATAIAGSLIGEVGGLGGGLLPAVMGTGKAWTGSFAPGFVFLAGVALAAIGVLALVTKRWTSTWVGEGGRARVPVAPAPAVVVPESVRGAA